MSERKLYQKFKDKIAKADPNCFWYKIPDTLNLGNKKPFDGFLVIKGVPFAIEFKSADGALTLYQSYQMTAFMIAGGESLLYIDKQETLNEFIDKIMTIIKEKYNG